MPHSTNATRGWMKQARRAAALLVFATTALASPTEGKPAPAFEARLLDGRMLDTASTHGKVVLLHYWATWCPPCREEMPVLEKFYKEHRGEGLEVIAISVEEPADEAKVRDFVKRFSFPVALASNTQAEGYGRIWVLPLSFLIDRKGVLKKSDWAGDQKIDAASLDKFVLPLLKER